MDQQERRSLNRGLGDGLTSSVEVFVMPAAFAGLGLLLDRWLGLLPVLTIALGAFGFVATLTTLWVRYDLQMRREETRLAERRSSRAATGSSA